jgi:hypothetical protein
MDFVILVALVAAGFGLASLLKANKESAFQEGMAAAERQRSEMERRVREARPLLAQCDQQLLNLILDIFSGRIRPKKQLPRPLFYGESYPIHPALLQWLHESVSTSMALEKLPESIYNNPWVLYEQIGPIPSRTREYMDDMHDRVDVALQDSEEEAFRLLHEACQPFLDLEERKLEEKRKQILADVSRICRILVESGFLTIVEEYVRKYERLVNGLPTGNLEVYYDPEHKGQTLVTYLVMRPELGPHVYEPYHLARVGTSSYKVI